LMLAGSVNYNLSLGYVLTFLLSAMGVNAMLHTFRNLAHLKVTAGQVLPVFAGEQASFVFNLENPGDLTRHSIGLTWDGIATTYVDIPPRRPVRAAIAVPAPRRGVLRPRRFKLYTQFPLGLYHAWSYLELDMECLVYPRPVAAGLPLPLIAAPNASGERFGTGDDDFAGLRLYQPGDSPRQIAWKAAAREDVLLTKQFGGRNSAACWLSWDDLPHGLGVEARLSQLTRWVLDAHVQCVSFGLRLPGTVLAPQAGDSHRDRCLRALALFDLHDESADHIAA
ncbi:MAG TPA: DUF58 domain-containing protein, partial [Burkholderiales bacterium]|nr:DUF58 domain-containing protein [Burkholderiales bacterium]